MRVGDGPMALLAAKLYGECSKETCGVLVAPPCRFIGGAGCGLSAIEPEWKKTICWGFGYPEYRTSLKKELELHLMSNGRFCKRTLDMCEKCDEMIMTK